jgi:hypothetical protein
MDYYIQLLNAHLAMMVYKAGGRMLTEYEMLCHEAMCDLLTAHFRRTSGYYVQGDNSGASPEDESTGSPVGN